MDWEELVKTFNLEKEVEKFVRERVKQIISGKHEFYFEGTLTPCSDDKPHIPHVVSHYDTVRYGTLQNFCLGREGEINGKTLIIVVEKKYSGNAWDPGYAKGYYFFK